MVFYIVVECHFIIYKFFFSNILIFFYFEIGNPDIAPSHIVAKIMERFQINDKSRLITDYINNNQKSHDNRPKSAPPTQTTFTQNMILPASLPKHTILRHHHNLGRHHLRDELQ